MAYASTGRTASLVAKYRPSMPVLALVVPTAAAGGAAAARDALTLARQCLIVRGAVTYRSDAALRLDLPGKSLPGHSAHQPQADTVCRTALASMRQELQTCEGSVFLGRCHWHQCGHLLGMPPAGRCFEDPNE